MTPPVSPSRRPSSVGSGRRRARRQRATGALVVVLVGLAACARIPTSGAVQEGVDEVAEPDEVVVLAEAPQQDSPPERIVADFLLASAAGLSGELDFTVARQYLAADAQTEWNPLGGVLVVDGYRTPERTSDTQVTIEAAVHARVDDDGRYAEASSDARETVTFDMVQDSRGQWRIASAPDGLVLSPRQFSDRFRAANLYFLTPDARQLTPEVRYYPAFNLPTSVVTGVLAGPSPWLRDAVRTAVPAGVQLTPASVPVDASGNADVTLGPAGIVQAADRDLLVAQIEATLRQLPQIRSVVVRAGTAGVPLEGTADLTTAGDAELAGGPEMIVGDELVGLVDGALQPVPEVGSLADLDARSPARSEDGSLRVMLSGPDRLVLAPSPDEPAATLLEEPRLVAPSVDRYGWVWTASDSQVYAVDRDGLSVPVAAPWLVDRDVEAVRVSRDGTRIAIVSSGPDGDAIDVAGIARDDVNGPQQLSEPAPRVGAKLTEADSVVWIDDAKLAVLARGTGTARVWVIPVGGESTTLPEPPGAVALAGGRAERSLLVVTEDGGLLRYDDPTWVPVAGVAGVRDPSYPG